MKETSGNIFQNQRLETTEGILTSAEDRRELQDLINKNSIQYGLVIPGLPRTCSCRETFGVDRAMRYIQEGRQQHFP